MAYDFYVQLVGFREGVQQKVNEYYTKNFPTLQPAEISVDAGDRYVRVWKIDKSVTGESIGKSIYCFIDAKVGETQGNILKAATWKAPAKNGVRGSVMNEDFGLSCVNHHGCIYLRR